jgi:hypothetical protein
LVLTAGGKKHFVALRLGIRAILMKVRKEPTRCRNVEVLLVLITQHVSDIIMPIIRRTTQSRQSAYGVQHWLCCNRLEERRQFRVKLFVMDTGVMDTNKTSTFLHLVGSFFTFMIQDTWSH